MNQQQNKRRRKKRRLNSPAVMFLGLLFTYVVVIASVGVRRATRLSPCDFKGFQRHLQSAYVLVRLIHLP